ncbi:MAG: hypothetical protein JW727_00995 [Candidatus Aenigmarchaeota archaeon]|nr:hypothetical protein [Candidatus Aenigmarchaeota archaeon]
MSAEASSNSTAYFANISGYSPEELRKELFKAEDLLTKSGRGSFDGLAAYFNVNGPYTIDPSSADLKARPNVADSLNALSDSGAYVGPSTGWDYKTMMAILERDGFVPEIGVFEGGQVYMVGGKLAVVAPVSEEVFYRPWEGVISKAADEEFKLAVQSNDSARQCYYVEAEEAGNLKNNIHVKGRKVSTEDLFSTLNTYRQQEGEKADYVLVYNETSGKIELDLTPLSVKHIYEALAKEYTLQSFRFGRTEEGRVEIWRDSRDKPVSLEDLERFTREVLPPGYKYESHPDMCVDFWPESVSGVTKESTARLVAKKVAPGKDMLLLSVGDRPSDIFRGKDTLFFAQKGSKAEKKALEEGIPYVPVNDAADYAAVAALLKESRGW